MANWTYRNCTRYESLITLYIKFVVCSVVKLCKQCVCCHTLIFVRIFLNSFLDVFLSAAPLSHRVTLLCHRIRRTAAGGSFRLFPFDPLTVLVFVLLGFLLEFLTCTARQRRAGDYSGGNCERGAGGRAGRGGCSGGRVLTAFLQGAGQGARRGVSAGRALVHGQVLSAAAFRGAGGVEVGSWAELLMRRRRGVGRYGEVGGRP